MDVAATSNDLFAVAVVIYSLAMLAFAADLAFSRRAAAVAVPAQQVPQPELVGVGARGDAVPAPPAAAAPAQPAEAVRPGWPVTARLALGLTALGWAVHLAEIVTRGVAAGRVPWGNMYEFSSVVALIAVSALLVLVVRHGMRWLGVFVLLPVVLYLGLAGTVLYVSAGPLVPALDSYWIKIHVVAAMTATGTFLVAGVITCLYVVRRRYDARVARDAQAAAGSLAARLPAAAKLDRTAYRVTAFAFPVWTFAIMAGAIWAESAWGRYWGWDPKETWSFITWVIYAAYLHARSTAAWRRYAPAIALLGFGALMVNYYVINTVVAGLHSYAF